MPKSYDSERCHYCKNRYGKYSGNTTSAQEVLFGAENRATIEITIKHCGHLDCETAAEKEAAFELQRIHGLHVYAKKG